MSARRHHVKVTLDDRELARLDEFRGPTARAVYLRRLLHEPPREPSVATRSESLSILTDLAREGSTSATVALARELREGEDVERFIFGD